MNGSDSNEHPFGNPPQEPAGPTPPAERAKPALENASPRPPQGPPPRRPIPPPRRSRTGLWIVLGIVGVALLGMVVLFTMLVAAVVGGDGGKSVGGAPVLHEESLGGHGEKKIVQIEVNGIIMSTQVSLFGPGVNMVERIKQQLRQAVGDPEVVAILLVVDSPGGGVTASDEIWNEVKKSKEAKKVIVHMGDLCASGGYYISAPADRIIASPTTITGSIGVIMSLFDASTLMQEKLGLKENNIKSGPFKDIGAMSRPMRADERAILQSIIDDMYGRFVKIVAEGRAGKGPIPTESKAAQDAVRKIADGRIYTADQALQNGLVDAVGYLEDAQQAARDLAKAPDARVIRYRRRVTLMDLFTGEAEGKLNVNTGVQVDAGSLMERPQMMYLWSPGR